MADEEQTIQVILDNLDEAPPILKGLSGTEFGLLCASSVGVSAIIGALILFFVNPTYSILGLVIGSGAGFIIAWKLAGYIGVKKQGTPSYLFWGLIMRHVQTKGINLLFTRLKVNFGFIPTQIWDNCSHKDGEK
ncbi:DUF3487 family protein [Vibrio gangliei]|uniref:DUF3487 family protein n=1 Tax=Vibrio gangliei TaxID=2077090 RepID=UPI000D020026|nr:DUF3487 family protein [Vibrio gangliei]